jgi:hypothetical protein
LQTIQIGESDGELNGIGLKSLTMLDRTAVRKLEPVDGRPEPLLVCAERRGGHLLQQCQQRLYLLRLVHLLVLEYLSDGRLLEKGRNLSLLTMTDIPEQGEESFLFPPSQLEIPEDVNQAGSVDGAQPDKFISHVLGDEGVMDELLNFILQRQEKTVTLQQRGVGLSSQAGEIEFCQFVIRQISTADPEKMSPLHGREWIRETLGLNEKRKKGLGTGCQGRDMTGAGGQSPNLPGHHKASSSRNQFIPAITQLMNERRMEYAGRFERFYQVGGTGGTEKRVDIPVIIFCDAINTDCRKRRKIH